jgi:hypothetical protein
MHVCELCAWPDTLQIHVHMKSEFVSILCLRALIFISDFCKGKIMVFLMHSMAWGPHKNPVFVTDARSSFLFAFYLHFATFITCKSFSISYSHLSQGLYIYLASLLCSIVITKLNHFSVLRISDVLYNSLCFWLVLIFQTSCSVTSPYTFLEVFLTQDLR